MARIAVSAPKDMENVDIKITVWLANGKSEPQIIPRKTFIGFSEPLEEAHLGVVEVTSSKITSTSTEECR
ncbi:hypothetical protein LAZ67_16001910 [Cordylochernes scorpioides]|uniref:Uncharacterized protein n=1 Tax=Cordylochernes scorpioides TaxID=51811 RepID=A0ABY6LCS2_9ARAC|nr:hypothetical protein LAZ67_16001910 [Cordylochernes scorpioides]